MAAAYARPTAPSRNDDADPYRVLCIELLRRAIDDAACYVRSYSPKRKRSDPKADGSISGSPRPTRQERAVQLGQDHAMRWLFGEGAGLISFRQACDVAGVPVAWPRRTAWRRMSREDRCRVLNEYGYEPLTTTHIGDVSSPED